MTYLASLVVIGYDPEEPRVFDTAREAWQYLADQRTQAEDESGEPGGYSATKNVLESLGEGMHAGTISDYENAGIDPDTKTGSIADGDATYTVTEKED